ncbi:hypothetical protein jhhlp_006153 [Lomentospora prolificans]|uniref:Transcription factor TFIIIC triple barrel domain-containing protein n=1 Tax=Lomentospora prolificans TaxID=41688 RepID=A0A2N3N541_9PEZI|nr:hypothetical protein jhhlp_006153 [Lomentospora prolificans]
MASQGNEQLFKEHRMPPMTATSNPPSANREVPQLEPEDDSDWEYEYSTTETETFYLTVDLSLPEFVYRNPSGIMHFGRGGYYADWIKDPESADKRSIAHRVVLPGGVFDDDDEDEDDDDEPLPEPEDDMDEVDPDLDDYPQRPQEGDTEVVDDKLVARDIEILDFHTEHPIISYRGKVFEGRWAEVLGTEMIFAEHDDAAPLPVLRRLPGDVDLLAASSARILTTEKVLKIPDELDRLKKTREAYGIRLPVLGKHHYDEKKKQVRFLENLMAVKIKKGEKDMVTVTARPAPDKDFADDRDPDWMPRRPRARMPPRELPMPMADSTSRGDGLRKPLPFSRPSTGADAASSAAQAALRETGGSVPTPDSWADILPEADESAEGEDDEYEDDETNDEEEDGDGDVSMG